MKINTVITFLFAATCLALAGCSGGGSGSSVSTGNNSGNSGGSTPDGDMDTGGDENSGNGSVPADAARSRYAFNNQCFALEANGNNRFVTRNGGRYMANADTAEQAEPFFMKPSALGKYLLYNSNRQLVTGNVSVVTNAALAAASDSAEWTLLGVGDTTEYPATPPVYQQPSVEYLNGYREFVDPNGKYQNFTLGLDSSGRRLTLKDGGLLFAGQPGEGVSQSFSLVPASGCAEFPEAQNNTIGDTFKGTKPDGSVLGMADVHVHISATEFLGGAEWGNPFDKFGVTHALGDGESRHGPNGSLDALGALYVGDYDGHKTAGWPTFPDWPAYDSLTHEAIYWKWLERAWKAGLRIAVNDVVENQTLCELERNVILEPGRDCNSMHSAIKQIATMYAMQDYIDAQYGGRGNGWFRIVLDPQAARQVIADGKLAVVLGIEISNLFDCQVNYNPLRTQEPYQETGTGVLENSYRCKRTETGAPNEILTQLTHLKDLGVRQIITIHEFDNAFGGNGIFNDLILNVGNRENSGGIPSGNLANITNLLNSGLVQSLRDPSKPDTGALLKLGPQALNAISGTLKDLESNGLELPTGEFWTTYDCPVEDKTPGFTGYIFGNKGGAKLQSIPPEGACLYTGQGGRPGGTTPCYPTRNQCNARWMTPIGQYTYEKIMQAGLILDFDHLELEMKSQLLELVEAQTPTYPVVSTHGTFGGTSVDQAQRVLRSGGFIYPSLGNGPDLLGKMEEMRSVYQAAMVGVPAADRPLYAMGFGTDTNGLSEQATARKNIAPGKAVTYPYTLFSGSVFDDLPEFNNINGVVFKQPGTRAPDGRGRTWSLDQDGSAQYGMLSGMVQEVRLEGNAEQMRTLFDSAERYLRTWELTLAASKAINEKGIVTPTGVLRPAPKPDGISGVGL